MFLKLFKFIKNLKKIDYKNLLSFLSFLSLIIKILNKMATEDNIISGFLEGELEYLFDKFGDEKYCKMLNDTLVYKQKVSSSSLQIKHYIIYGSECSICLEKILTKKTAFINDCGHYFHKKCIFYYMNLCNNNNNDGCCPLCRKIVNYDSLELYEKYNSSHKEFNFLDKLENFYNDDVYNLDHLYCKKCNYFTVGKRCVRCYN
jgi:hypothetical protein